MTADSQKILTHEIENNDHPEARISITGRAVRSNFVGQDRKQLDLRGQLLGMKHKLKNFVNASTQLAEESKSPAATTQRGERQKSSIGVEAPGIGKEEERRSKA